MQRDDLLISTAELAALAGRPDVRVVDARWSLDDPDAGEREHELAHIPGAAHFAPRSAGFERRSVYDGSWSEWSADPETPKEAH